MTEQEAAIILQKHARRRLAQKSVTPPKGAPKSYSTFVTGNEPNITFSPSEKQTSGRFAFIGCSGMKSLEIIKNLIDWDSYTGSPDGYNNIPKLFILDNSHQVVLFWNLLKQSCASAATLDECKANVLILRDKFRLCSNRDSYGVADEVVNNFIRLSNSNEMYQFLRGAICKATLITHDWANSDAFDFIHRHIDSIPTYVYASNILEYISSPYNYSYSVMEQQANVGNILRNISTLNPTMTLHTRTSDGEFRLGGGHSPDRYLKLTTIEPSLQLQALTDPEFITMTEKLKKSACDCPHCTATNCSSAVKTMVFDNLDDALAFLMMGSSKSRATKMTAFSLHSDKASMNILSEKKGVSRDMSSTDKAKPETVKFKRKPVKTKRSPKEFAGFRRGFLL